jgi:5-methylcytosine-specific restriction protein B
MKQIKRELVDAFMRWYENDTHSSNENYYQADLTCDKLSELAKEDFVEFFFQFARDGGKVQSGGHRTAGKFRETMEAQYDDFRAFAVEPFSQDFDVKSWLSRIDNFNGFGKGLATIYLNRIDNKRFAILNNKAVEAFKLLEVRVPNDLTAQYEAIRKAELQLMEWYPEFKNLYQVDALTHFLIGTDEGKPWKDTLHGPATASPRYWLMAVGRGAEHWETCLENGVILYGADKFQDLTPYDTKKKMTELFATVFEDGEKKTNNILATYEFAHVMKEDDIVIIKKGLYELLGYGRVTSGYRWDESRDTYRNTRDVEWIKTGKWSVPEEEQLVQKTLTDLTPYEGYAEKLIRIMEGKNGGVVIADILPKFIEQAQTTELSSKHLNRDIDKFKLKASFGQGNQARIPWIALLGAGQTTMDGIYPVYLYYRAQQKLLLCYGISETNRPKRSWGMNVEQQFSRVSEVIDNPARYGASFVFKEYDVLDGKLHAPADELEAHFNSIKNEYQRVLSESNKPLSEQKELGMPFSQIAFAHALLACGLKLASELPSSICAALHTKPFLILTGLSGSGKTQLAQAFSKWVCTSEEQWAVVAVGADWTSNENLLGYPDALKEKSYRKPDNGALDLVLRAKNDPENPYFLILDEMNLSHVERYFADFLSAMESGEAINLHDGDENELWDTDSGGLKVPGKLKIPKNLFVIGTVNVDETTYMFSPKVLDRANVIEFRVSGEEMKSFLANPVKPNLEAIAGQGVSYARAFVAAAKQKEFALDEQEQVSAVLMKFFPELKEAGAEFGYRTAHEISRFIYFHKQLTGAGWEIKAAMDAAIMQKLLPKLHGARRKLEPILEKLEKLCEADYPRSLEKVQRMLKRLREHGFTSFAEA